MEAIQLVNFDLHFESNNGEKKSEKLLFFEYCTMLHVKLELETPPGMVTLVMELSLLLAEKEM